jgi:hypothetical protein
MPIQCSCPGCHQTLSAPDNSGGKQAMCQVCKTLFLVPLPTATLVMASPVIVEKTAKPYKHAQETGMSIAMLGVILLCVIGPFAIPIILLGCTIAAIGKRGAWLRS